MKRSGAIVWSDVQSAAALKREPFVDGVGPVRASRRRGGMQGQRRPAAHDRAIKIREGGAEGIKNGILSRVNSRQQSEGALFDIREAIVAVVLLRDGERSETGLVEATDRRIDPVTWNQIGLRGNHTVEGHGGTGTDTHLHAVAAEGHPAIRIKFDVRQDPKSTSVAVEIVRIRSTGRRPQIQVVVDGQLTAVQVGAAGVGVRACEHEVSRTRLHQGISHCAAGVILNH